MANPSSDATKDVDSQVTQLDLLRHGECEGGNIFRGHLDVHLTPAGLKRMHKVAQASQAQWHSVISSPLQRCWQCVQSLPLADNTKRRHDVRLQEMSFGDWDGKKITDVWADDYERIARWTKNPAQCSPPNGESLEQVEQRIRPFLQECLAEQRGKKILLVTHGGIVRVILSHLLGMPMDYANRWQVPYACFTRLAIYHHAQQPPLIQLVAHNFIQVD